MALKKPKKPKHVQYEKLYDHNPLEDVDAVTRERIAPLENWIMKNCLWQFNSRGWDRRKQNAGILGKTAQLLAGEKVENPTLLDKCYWTDAVMLERSFREVAPWIRDLDADQIKSLIKTLHARIDWLMIDGSLNEELTVQQY